MHLGDHLGRTLVKALGEQFHAGVVFVLTGAVRGLAREEEDAGFAIGRFGMGRDAEAEGDERRKKEAGFHGKRLRGMNGENRGCPETKTAEATFLAAQMGDRNPGKNEVRLDTIRYDWPRLSPMSAPLFSLFPSGGNFGGMTCGTLDGMELS